MDRRRVGPPLGPEVSAFELLGNASACRTWDRLEGPLTVAVVIGWRVGRTGNAPIAVPPDTPRGILIAYP